MQEIDPRTQREKEAWNKDDIVRAQGFKRKIRAAFENPHGENLEKMREEIIRNRCQGATILDYGCYEGLETRKYLDYGASSVYGIDISESAIERALQSVDSGSAQFMVADAHHLPFPEGIFDLIVGRAILHHLELPKAYAEIARVLKPGGLALFVEPLGANPLAKVVRFCTPNARTVDEKPLGYSDIVLGNTLVGEGSHHYSGFVSAPVGAAVSLCGGRTDNWIMKVAALGDEAVGATPLKYWGRVVFLQFHKSSF